ncbi:helix-turn-helix domain-containing protein [Streptomyces durmitorensis]|uniref:Helix-turn-helix domain-containing protein n=1 Tax=Streptomyces durmitorensis TaxID=319947 RepID=A0ABY4Q209_9ACTN|nr:helix-turn-helix domain-containing protein [Streptomyces durmitorensis]UQT59113.1 helix-turn-helix domain-containing protein [Streptomyces durmitorensis]
MNAKQPEPRQSRRITDVGTLKAFGHPLRLKIYSTLRVAGPSTASQLAGQVDEAVSLVSYHLRKLAEHGLIEEAETQSEDARERWWQAAQETLSFRHEDFKDTPEGAAAHTAVVRTLIAQREEQYETYLAQQEAWGAEWRKAADQSDFLARLNPAELTRLNAEIHALVKTYEAQGKATEAAGDTEGRENVAVHLASFPFRI